MTIEPDRVGANDGELARGLGGVVAGDGYALRPIVVRKHVGEGQYRLQMLPDFHPSYDPLQYPLLLPQGTDGWYPQLVQYLGRPLELDEQLKKLTQTDFYR